MRRRSDTLDLRLLFAFIVGKAYTELGKELYEAQQGLSKKGYGCFEEWFTTLGFKKRNVYRLIDRYKLVRANLAQTDLLEDLPVSLSYEIASPSAENGLRIN